ncbi:hypothetical protein ACFPYI_02425 [Halomarina salina]|uniref:ArsR family transcriptional regulator n=1 Tax=Halomarina salina TaxID=1872699 RepID=A0ABD5RIJ2_9EURY|nr:hypothetical protein [Halomarina salina]
MRTVHDDDGRRYLLLKRSSESSLVRDPTTGEERYLPNDDLTADEEDTDALGLAAAAVPDTVRRVLSACRDDRSLGLLLELDRRGPVPARALMEYDLCESDVLGLVGEFRAAGLVVEADVGGERGYDVTDDAREALAVLRSERTAQSRTGDEG